MRSSSESLRTRRETLQLIQVFRGAAATMVMLYHVSLTNRFYSPFLWGAFEFGHSGIDFFFVLSGFIMLYVHYDGAGRRAGVVTRVRAAARFLALRAVRIFPIYWCVLAATVMLFWMYPPRAENFWAPLSTLEPATLLNAVFLADPDRAIVPVAWTLTYEVIFYAFFSLYFLVGAPIFAVLAIGWFAAIAGQWSGIICWPYPILLRTIVGEFLLGCLAAVVVKRFGPRKLSAWSLVPPIALIAVMARAEMTGAIDPYQWWATPYFLLIVVGAAYDQATARRYPRVLVLLGEASYTIYLIHYGMIIMFAETIALPSNRATISQAPNTTLLVLSMVIVLSGILVHWTIERPLLIGARRRLGIRRE